MLKIFAILTILINSFNLMAKPDLRWYNEEEEFEEVEPWDLENLSEETLDLKIEYYMSSGYFITLPPGYFDYILHFNSYFTWSTGSPSNPIGTAFTGNGYSPKSNNPLPESFEVENSFGNSRIWERNNYEPSAGSVGLQSRIALPMPLNIIGNLGYSRFEFLATHDDHSKRFLTSSGELKTLKEKNIMFITDRQIDFSLGLELPIYGAAMVIDSSINLSYYFLQVSYGLSYVIASETHQFTAIENYADGIYYSNGENIRVYSEEARIEGVQDLRHRIDVSLGWHATFANIPISFALHGGTFISPLYNGTDWNIWFVGLKTSFIGFSNIW